MTKCEHWSTVDEWCRKLLRDGLHHHDECNGDPDKCPTILEVVG